MDSLQKVVWAEGMFLRPQHFQQQQRYFEFFSHRRSEAAEPFFWGFRNIELEPSALAIGKLAILSASGIFPDGTPFDFPAQSPCPEPLHFDEGAVDQKVYLVIPLAREGTENVIFERNDASLARYEASEAMVRDENAFSGEPAEIQVGIPRARLMLEKDFSGSWVKVGVCWITECRGNKQVILGNYAPPVVQCVTSTFLITLLNEVIGLINQRAGALAERLSQPGRGGVSEVAEFLLLQVLNRFQPLFEHILATSQTHPERLFSALLQLTGELATFTEETRRPGAWPKYDHDDLFACLTPLIIRLRHALASVLEQNAIQIALHMQKYGVRIGQVNDRELLRSAQFVLAVHANTTPEFIRTNFPSQAKIGPSKHIRELVNLHLPGVGLRLLPVAPRQIPYHAGYHYFEMDTAVELWDQLQETGTLALHVAGEFPGLEMECWAIRRQ